MPEVQTPPSAEVAEARRAEWLYRQFMPGDEAGTAQFLSASADRHARSLGLLLSRLRETGLFPDHETAIDHALVRLGSGDDEGRMKWLTSPILRSWMAKAGQAIGSEQGFERLAELLTYLPNVSVDTGQAGRHRLIARKGLIEVADLRLRLESAVVDGPVDLTVAADGTIDGQEVRLGNPAFLAGTRIALRADLPSLRLKIRTDRVPERESTVIGDALDEGDPFYPDPRIQPFDTAVRWLADVWPEELADWRMTTHVIVPFAAPAGWTSDGFTVSTLQGAIWCSQDNALRTYESLIHEQSHIKLRYMEEAVPLLSPVQGAEYFSVGWRSDPRPMVGVYEGVYVHAHILHGLLRLQASGLAGAGQLDALSERIAFVRQALGEGANLLKEHARFTDAGQVFLRWATDEAARHRD